MNGGTRFVAASDAPSLLRLARLDVGAGAAPGAAP